MEVKELRGSLELGACSRWRVRASRRRRELGARPSLLCREELRGRVRDVEGAGEIAEPRRAACRTCLTVGRWRGDVEGHTTSHHEGEGSLHGLLELLRSSKLHVIKTLMGPIYPSSVLGSFFTFE